MSDRTSVIFQNPIDRKTIRKAEKSQASYLRKFGDDRDRDYPLSFEPIPALDSLGIRNIVFGTDSVPFPDNALIVGNIRMGFGHYRISIAMASAARALGFEPYWLDLASFDATGSKMIRAQNDLYSMGSRLSQKSRLFNKLFWEPMNSEGFKKLTYNAVDQKNSELLVPIFRHIGKDIPFIATHAWPSQAAVHAGMTHVVNAIPDNWPMALHLSEGSIHAVQTPFAYQGYKSLAGFAKTPLKGMSAGDIRLVGCYIDHELLINLEEDNRLRKKRAKEGSPLRLLMTVGGAGAGVDFFLHMIRSLLPRIRNHEVALLINFGDHKAVYEQIVKELSGEISLSFVNRFNDLKAYASGLRGNAADGITAILNDNIFEAVYATNLLLPETDYLITKPSELAYYPVPKVFMKHIGGHEVYGAIWGSQMGDATPECPTYREMTDMLDRILTDRDLLIHYCERIDRMHQSGCYDGAYNCVKLATGQLQI